MWSPSSPPLPAEATTTEPLASAYCTAASSAASGCAEALSSPRERLMTSAPWSAAQRIPWARAPPLLVRACLRAGSVDSRMTRTGRIFASGAMPSTPSARPGPCPWPAMIPAIAVPWRAQGRSPCLAPNPMKSLVGSTCPARSGWPASTPVSRTATVTPLPLVVCQTFCVPIASSAHCWARMESAWAVVEGSTATAAAVSRATRPRRLIEVSPLPWRPRSVRRARCAPRCPWRRGRVLPGRRPLSRRPWLPGRRAGGR